MLFCLFILWDVFYSYRNASTGFFVDARQLIQLTVRSVIPRVSNPARVKIHQLSSVLTAKSSNHLCMAYQAIGQAITKETATHFIKSLLSKTRISEILAPLILRIPISLVCCLTIKDERPKIPCTLSKSQGK
jgi:hypothetical protein